jgi:hypothetical protein
MGGPYSPIYVKQLKNAVKTNCKISFDFVCLTDDPQIDFCAVIPLLHGWPGWWSKIELFRPDLQPVPVLYLDLDTVILGNIDKLLLCATENPFIALRGFNHRFRKPGHENFASGIMAGNFHDYSFVYHAFLEDPVKHINAPRENWMHGDQGFIADQIGVDNIPRLQSKLTDTYIVGKRLLHQFDKIPSSASVIAWSGQPRLHEINASNSKIEQLVHNQWIKYNE